MHSFYSIDLEQPAVYPTGSDPEDTACVQFLKYSLKLGSHLSIALRSIYSVRMNAQRSIGPEPEAKIVAQLDAGLDRWLHSLPEECT